MKLKTVMATATIGAAIFAGTAQAKPHYTPHTKCVDPETGYVIWAGPFRARLLTSLGWKCDPFPTTASTVEIVDVDNTFGCGHAGDQPTAVPVDEFTGDAAGTRSLVNKWFAATAHAGNVVGGTNVGKYHLDCIPTTDVVGYTDDSGSFMQEANTEYANPIAGS